MKYTRNFKGSGKKGQRKTLRKIMSSQVTGNKRNNRLLLESSPRQSVKKIDNTPHVQANYNNDLRNLTPSYRKLNTKKAILSSFFLVLVLGGIQSGITLNRNINNVNNVNVKKVLVVSCSANTCRSAMVGHEASKMGYNITTCGTSKDNTWGNPMTKAARDIMSGDELTIANKHTSQECNVCSGLNGNEIFGVMAQKNKDQLIKQAEECGIEPPEIHVLGDIPELRSCKALQNDPWYETTENTCPDGNCTPALIKREQNAYQKLAVDAHNCVEDIVEWSQNGGPQLRLSKGELDAIAEGVRKKLKKKHSGKKHSSKKRPSKKRPSKKRPSKKHSGKKH